MCNACAGIAVGVCGRRSKELETSGENGCGFTGLEGEDDCEATSDEGERAFPDNNASIVKPKTGYTASQPKFIFSSKSQKNQ